MHHGEHLSKSWKEKEKAISFGSSLTQIKDDLKSLEMKSVHKNWTRFEIQD